MSERYRPPLSLRLFQFGLWSLVALIVGWFVMTTMLNGKAPGNEHITPTADTAAAPE